MHHETLDLLSRGDSLVHRLDARVKIVAVVLYTFALIATDKYEIAGLAPFVLFPAFLVLFGEVPLGFLAKGVALGLPFVFMVAVFNPVFDAAPRILRIGPWEWTPRGGTISCVNILLRFLLTASSLVAVMATTPFHRIVNGLRRMRFPAMLLMVLSFLHRYLFVLVDVAGRMRRARDSRAAGGEANAGGRTLALRFHSFAGVLGVLFLRSLDQSERIYAAMRSRGFSGELPSLDHPSMRSGDWLFLALSAAYAVILGWAGR